MNPRLSIFLSLVACASLQATVSITSFSPSLQSPQKIGTPVTFNVQATDSAAGPLTFQFNVSYSGGAYFTFNNFNVGTLSGGTWTAQPFVWAEIASEGPYSIQVVAKDFATGQSATETISYSLTTPIVGGKLTVLPTANPLVALAAIPACPAGSYARAAFKRASAQTSTYTEYLACHSPASTNFYLAGMYPSATYEVSYQIDTKGVVTNGPSTAIFKTGPLPTNIGFPMPTLIMPATSQAYTTDNILLHAYLNPTGTNYVPTATDLEGNTIWYYNTTDLQALMTRPLVDGYVLALQTGLTWTPGGSAIDQLVNEIDLSGNIVRQTNIGLLQQQLVAKGASDFKPCSAVPLPAAPGAACLTAFSHDAISLPGGLYAVIASLEKIFPPGTQNNTSGENVDILGDSIVVLDSNFNVTWYWESFQHDGGGTQLDINRPAILNEGCTPTTGGCPPLFLYGTPGIASPANDWMHSNSLYYDPTDGNFVLSLRNQDWVLKINYLNGTGNGTILWRMGVGGDFAFNNVNNDPFPWFSHQHDVGFSAPGLLTVFDNGNTRVAYDATSAYSRGMALNVDVSTLQVTPVLSQDLNYYATALGSAQLLPNGDYHFQPGLGTSYSLEYVPIQGTVNGTEVFNLEENASSYRSFRLPSLYSQPTE